MIDLLSVNTYASMAQEYIAQFDKDKCSEVVKALEQAIGQERGTNKLEEKATASGSDNSWNRYESVDEAYAYGLELKSLLEDYVADFIDWDDITMDLADIVSKSGSEMMYRLERAQW